MRIFLVLVLTFVTVSQVLGAASADGLSGTWRTEDDGGYLHIEFSVCEKGYCGVITGAFSEDDERADDYEHLGKSMVWDMMKSGPGRWSGGKIWDPVGGKTYKSKLELDDGVLKVSGCVAFFCRSQDWTRVK